MLAETCPVQMTPTARHEPPPTDSERARSDADPRTIESFIPSKNLENQDELRNEPHDERAVPIICRAAAQHGTLTRRAVLAARYPRPVSYPDASATQARLQLGHRPVKVGALLRPHVQLIKTQAQGVGQAGNRQERRRGHTAALQAANRVDGHGRLPCKIRSGPSLLLALSRDENTQLPTMFPVSRPASSYEP